MNVAFAKFVFLLTVPQLRPICILFGVLIDYTNYDIEAPSVRIFDPLSGRVLVAKDLVTNLPRRPRNITPPPAPAEDGAPQPEGVRNVRIEAPALLQSWGPEDVPFLCVPGVREYHDNPAHTGDSWLLHRRDGAGTVDAILNVLHTYGVAGVRGYAFEIPTEGGDQQYVVTPNVALRVELQP